MRCYTVKALGKDARPVGIRYAGTAADAKTTREELMTVFGLNKKDVVIDTAVIETQKDDLLVFINDLLRKQDKAV